MKRFKKHLSPVMIMVLFAVAIAMLLGGSISGTRAALTYYSETYTSRIHLFDIGVMLLENGDDEEKNAVCSRGYTTDGSDPLKAFSNDPKNPEVGRLLTNMLEDGESLKLGAVYPEVLKVKNTGTINQYVRVSIYKYWVKGNENEKSQSAEDGLKNALLQKLDPSMINLHLTEDSGWLLDPDPKSSTKERTVLYYSECLGVDEISEPFADTLTIDEAIAKKVSESTKTEANGTTTITTTYLYDGAEFRIDVKVDAVQEHNAEDAIWSAWGKHVKIDETTGRLSFAD